MGSFKFDHSLWLESVYDESCSPFPSPFNDPDDELELTYNSFLPPVTSTPKKKTHNRTYNQDESGLTTKTFFFSARQEETPFFSTVDMEMEQSLPELPQTVVAGK